MTNYTRGVALEYDIKRLLEEHGWTVTRSAGSHGIFDLVAEKESKKYKNRVYFAVFQAKRMEL